MAETLEYIAPPGTEASVACRRLADHAWAENRPHRMSFNGIEIVAQPGDTSSELLDRWWKLRNERERQEAQQRIVITNERGLWCVRVGERWSDKLDFGEMLATVVHLTVRGEIRAVDAPYGGLRNQAEHAAYCAAMGVPVEETASVNG